LSKGYPLYFPFEGGEITCWQYDILVCNSWTFSFAYYLL
jgi:hypothetical protein